MSTIVTRAGKGSALTHNEVDANFTNLNTDKLQSGNTAAALTITSATINGGAINSTTVGATTPSAGAFTTLSASSTSTLNGTTIPASSTLLVSGGALGTPSSGTVTNLTGTASININGTVGATTPAAGTFTSLSDSGNLTFTGTGNRITGDFSNATFANRVAFQTSTVNGITTVNTIPNGTGTASQYQSYNAADPTNSSLMSIGVGATDVAIQSAIRGTGTYLPMTFYTGGSERMRIDTSGYVQIGTATADGQVHIKAAAGQGVPLTLTNTDASGNPQVMVKGSRTYQIGTGNSGSGFAGQLFFYDGTAAATRMIIDSSGNVGIGTSSPSTRLIVSSSGANGLDLAVDQGNAVASARLFFSNGTAGQGYSISNDTGSLKFNRAATAGSSTGTESMRIDSSGTLLVGTTTKYGKVTSENSTTFDPTASSNLTNCAIAAHGAYGGGVSVIDGTQGYTMWAQASGADFYIRRATTTGSYTGGVFISNAATSWSSASDERLKNIIRPIENAAEKLLSLRCVIGEYKDNVGEHHPFLIAQDVQAVFPEVVNEFDKENGYLGMSYTDMVPILIKAIQEQQQMIETLQAEVAALKGA